MDACIRYARGVLRNNIDSSWGRTAIEILETLVDAGLCGNRP